ncbi:histone deacetylase [Starmerella bacillaris]|uniref:Histone deacetylase n=1 Tax=Starmerella bacillaris TaxID=1247836 RepID=A0AAV5RFM1_STABA|nr:histone deacetylase [Starmerella bacillaris]
MVNLEQELLPPQQHSPARSPLLNTSHGSESGSNSPVKVSMNSEVRQTDSHVSDIKEDTKEDLNDLKDLNDINDINDLNDVKDEVEQDDEDIYEVYENEVDEIDDEDSNEDDSELLELAGILEDCLDAKDNGSEVPRVTVSKDFAQEVVEYLVMNGVLLFIAKYVLNAETSYPTGELLAALGYELPTELILDGGLDSRKLQIMLQLAMRDVLDNRKRLPAPRTLDEVVECIAKAENIIVVTGAGISTSLGIPDFRSDDGLYRRLESLGLNDPQEVFDIRTFKADPSIFYSIAKQILPEEKFNGGTPTHKFIKLLSDNKKLLRNYTQNIDNLEQSVGIPLEKLVQCHGSFGSARCFTCGFEVKDGRTLYPQIRAAEIPRCPECKFRKTRGKRKSKPDSDNATSKKHNYNYKSNVGDEEENDEDDEPSYGVIKPDITFFGESLPSRFDNLLFEGRDARNCDLLLCLGTSLRVSPVSEIVHVVGRHVPQIYISKTKIRHVTFEAEFVGSCDDTVELLAKKLGWDLDHPMCKRPNDMPDSEYPGGKIEYDNGLFVFRDASENGDIDSNKPAEDESESDSKDDA